MMKWLPKIVGGIADRLPWRRKRRTITLATRDGMDSDRLLAVLGRILGTEEWEALSEILDREILDAIEDALDPKMEFGELKFHLGGVGRLMTLKSRFEEWAEAAGVKREEAEVAARAAARKAAREEAAKRKAAAEGESAES